MDNLSTTEQAQPTTNASNDLPFELSDIPRYSGSPFCEVNNNKPYFQSDELTTDSFRQFSELDSLGRCGVAFACIGTDSLPTEERGAIGMIKPSGWHTVRYDDLIEDKYLYNRCHTFRPNTLQFVKIYAAAPIKKGAAVLLFKMPDKE